MSDTPVIGSVVSLSNTPAFVIPKQVHVLLVTYRDKTTSVLGVFDTKDKAETDRRSRLDRQPEVYRRQMADWLRIETWPVQ